MSKRDRFEISLIDFEKCIFQKIVTNSIKDEYLIKTSDNSINIIGSYLPGLMTITGDLSAITEPRDLLIKKATEDYMNRIKEIYGIHK